MLRLCKKCGETKPLEDFTEAPNCHFGRRYRCKACSVATARASGAIRQRPAEDLGESRTCCRCGVEKVLADFYRTKGYRQRVCKECAKRGESERYRARQETDALVISADGCTATARKRGADVVEDVVPLVVLERDDGMCGICGEDVDPMDFHVDHIVAVRDGGAHSYANVQVAHPACNIQKGVRERNARRRRGAAA